MKRAMPWFRFYAEALSDPKVQRLSPELFRAWVNLLCLASQHGGTLPSVDDMAFHLRISSSQAAQQLDDLILAGLLDILPDGVIQPHNWHVRQYASDTSTERVRKHREKRQRNVSGNSGGNVSGNGHGSVSGTADETPPEPDTETDTEGLTPLTPLASLEPPNEDGVWPEEKFVDRGRDGPLPIRPETLAKAARKLGVADVAPLLPAFERWPKSQAARDRDALFLAAAPKLLANARPSIRAACQPLAELVGADPPATSRSPRPSAELTASLRRDLR